MKIYWQKAHCELFTKAESEKEAQLKFLSWFIDATYKSEVKGKLSRIEVKEVKDNGNVNR